MERGLDLERETTSAAWDGAPPRVSVVIPTYDHVGYLADLLPALETQTAPRSDFEVVVVDNGSSDGTWDALARFASATPLRMRIARVNPNIGPGPARNTGAALARAAVLAFTDDDCIPSPGWVEALAGATANGTALVQGRTLPEPGVAQGPWDRFIWVTGPTPLYETCNLAVSKAAFHEAGGFPTDRLSVTRGTRTAFGEDVQMAWAVRAAGRRAGYCAEALVHHRVIPAGYPDWLAEQRRMGLFPGLVRAVPGLRRELLRFGVFLSDGTARFDLAVAAVAAAAATRRPWLAVGALPWLNARWRDATGRPGRPRPARLAQLAIGDALGLVSLVAGSVRDRRLVL